MFGNERYGNDSIIRENQMNIEIIKNDYDFIVGLKGRIIENTGKDVKDVKASFIVDGKEEICYIPKVCFK
jgi:hypothetical protein